jgi:hypothetical protein
MAISFISQTSGTDTFTMPSHETGDLLVVFAYRDGSTTAPGEPAGAGWSTIGSGGGSSNSSRISYKIAASNSEVSGTWTNATTTFVHVYRGVKTSDPIGDNNVATGSSTTITHPALSLAVTDGSSWVASFFGHRSTNATTLTAAPSGMINRSSSADATDQGAGFDTNGGVSSFASRTTAIGGTSSNWIARSVEIEAQPPSKVYFIT